MKWDHQTDAKLLGVVLRIHQIKLDYTALAAAMGGDCTAKALMHRFAKLKGVANGTDSLNNTPTTTPAKRGRPAKKTTTATGVAEGGNDAVDDEEHDTPAKKRGVKRKPDASGDDDATPAKKPRAKRARKPAAKKEESVTEVEEDGDEGFPLDQEIKIEDGIIKVQQGGEED